MDRSHAFAFAGIGGILTLFTLISLASSGWLISPPNPLGITLGIGIWAGFQAIIPSPDIGPNIAVGPGTSDINAVRAFMLLGFFAQMGAVLVCLLLALAKTENKTLASIFFAISGLCLFIALVVFAAAFEDTPFSYGYSFVLGWISCVFTMLTAVAVLTAEKFLAQSRQTST